LRELSTPLLRGAGNIFGAKLLFQWRVVENGKARQRRLCEERIVLMRARSSRDALAQAKRYGRAQAHKDPTNRPRGREVYFEFVGIIDLDTVFANFTEHPTEVWYELRERVRPMERKRELLVPESRFHAARIPRPRRGRVVI
jgi:hypothetical protein